MYLSPLVLHITVFVLNVLRLQVEATPDLEVSAITSALPVPAFGGKVSDLCILLVMLPGNLQGWYFELDTVNKCDTSKMWLTQVLCFLIAFRWRLLHPWWKYSLQRWHLPVLGRSFWWTMGSSNARHQAKLHRHQPLCIPVWQECFTELDWVSHNEGIFICHALNAGEKQLGWCMRIPGLLLSQMPLMFSTTGPLSAHPHHIWWASFEHHEIRNAKICVWVKSDSYEGV